MYIDLWLIRGWVSGDDEGSSAKREDPNRHRDREIDGIRT